MNNPVNYKRGWEHGEPGGPGGRPIAREFRSEPVNFIDRHPLQNDPEATPLIAPYTGAFAYPRIPGQEQDY